MAAEDVDPAELERLFRRGPLSRRQLTGALAGLGMAASGIEMLLGAADVEPAEARPALPRYFVLIVLDAFRPDYANLAPMPSLQRLIQSGTSYPRAWVGQLESETPSGHATLSTGALPKHHGILGFEWRDPRTGREVLDGWPPGVLAGALERDLQQAPVNSIPHAVKAADPRAKIVAISSEKVYAADAMGAASADYVLHCRRTSGKLVPMGIPHHEPPAGFSPTRTSGRTTRSATSPTGTTSPPCWRWLRSSNSGPGC
jgi:hypothetical protein